MSQIDLWMCPEETQVELQRERCVPKVLKLSSEVSECKPLPVSSATSQLMQSNGLHIVAAAVSFAHAYSRDLKPKATLEAAVSCVLTVPSAATRRAQHDRYLKLKIESKSRMWFPVF